jgi:hypothetical protein
MANYQQFPVTTAAGITGFVFRNSRFLDKSEVSLVKLDDGREFQAPNNALHVQPDGSFLLEDGAPLHEDPAPENPAPVEEVQQPPAPVRTRNEGNISHNFTVNESLLEEAVNVERVPVNRFIEQPVETRQEGDVTIVPVMEEVLVVQRRLMLKEEIRITRRREQRKLRKVVLSGAEPRILGPDGRDIES